MIKVKNVSFINYGVSLVVVTTNRLCAGWEEFRLPVPLLIENMLMKLRTKVDRYSSAGTEAWLCNLLNLDYQAQLA